MKYPQPDLCGCLTVNDTVVRIPVGAEFRIGHDPDVCHYLPPQACDYISPVQCIIHGTVSPDTQRFWVTLEHRGAAATFVDGRSVRRGTRKDLRDRNTITFEGAQDYVPIAVLEFKLFRPGSVNSKVNFVKTIGRGSGGEVLLAVCRNSGRHFAVKKIPNTLLPASRNPGIFELQTMKRLNNENIIRFYGYKHDSSYFYILMQFAPHGSVGDMLDGVKIHEVDTQIIARHVGLALRYLHVEMNMVHRDVKPHNILITKLEPLIAKLADFGLTKVITGKTESQAVCGTAMYMAPEVVLAGNFPYLHYDHKVDCWSFGVTIYTLLAGRGPFEENEVDYRNLETRYDHREPKWDYLPSYVSARARALLSHLILRDARLRLTIRNAINHAWFSDEFVMDAVPQRQDKCVVRLAAYARARKDMGCPSREDL